MTNIDYLNSAFNLLKISARCVGFNEHNNYFHYDVELMDDCKVKDIERYSDEISMLLKTNKPRIKILHSEGIIRLEFANNNPIKLKLFDILFVNEGDGELPCLLGTNTDGSCMWMDLAKNPHMIVAGTTGSGKSTLLHNIIANLLYNGNAILYLIDPKGIEFIKYDGKIDCVTVGYSYDDACYRIDSLINVMNQRFSLLKDGYSLDSLPYVVLIIDEFADLILQDNKSLYNKLCLLAQKCRASKISIILATQRPSAKIIDGNIKANFPARIACKTASHIDSKVVLDATGAQNLFGNGDALVRDNFRTLDRFQIAYTSADEVCQVFSD